MDELRNEIAKSVVSSTDSDNDANFVNSPTSIIDDHRDPSIMPSDLIHTKDSSGKPFSIEWLNHEKHIFVCSTAGKPIYSKYGQISELASFIALLHSLISFYQTIQSIHDESDELICIKSHIAGKENHHLVIYFMIRSPLYLIQICQSQTIEPISFIKQELFFLYEQIIGLTSTFQMERVFRANYDVSRWIVGHENILDRVIPTQDSHHSWLVSIKLDAIPVYPVSKRLRRMIRETFESFLPSPSFILFGMLISLHDQSIIYVYDPMKHLSGIDIFCIMNRISSIDISDPFEENNEIWTFICCPRYLPEAFLHMYYSQLTNSVGLMLCTERRDGLQFCSEIRSQWNRLWSRSACMTLFSLDQQILSIWSKEGKDIVPYDIPSIDGLLHFIYIVDKLVYIPSTLYASDSLQIKRWIRHYKQLIYVFTFDSVWIQDKYETIITERHHGSYELYAILDYHITEQYSRRCLVPKLLRYLKKHLYHKMKSLLI